MKKSIISRKTAIYTKNEIKDFSYTSPCGAFCIQEPHRHTFYEFTIITSGTCEHSIDGNQPFFLSRGDVYFVTPQNIHQLSNLPENHQHRDFYATTEKMKEICKAFNFDFIGELPKLAPVFRKKLTENQLVALEEKATFFNPNLYTFSPEILEDIHTSIIADFLGIILQSNHEKRNLLPDWITTLVQRLDSGDFILNSVEEIVKTTGYAHGYVCRQFKKYMGKTLLSYNNAIKLRESVNLLKTHSVMQTASILGWDNPKNYNISFKKLYGLTPSQYRKSIQDENA
ncbi:MAG: helix-turn-helix domain-containing protein [Clostridia bacterium]|nr:helix-turn-helix domain-containing protein [Clostridia bacterium]